MKKNNNTEQTKRAQYGKGGISLRPDGRYNVSYKGRQTTAKNETAAKRKLSEWRHEEDRPKAQTGRLTIRQGMTIWLENVQKPLLKPRSYDRKLCTCEHQVFPYVGKIQVSSLRAEDAEGMLLKLYEKNLSYSSLKKAFEALNGYIKYLVDKRVMPYNPIASVKIPKPETVRSEDIKFYTEPELKLIYTEAVRKYQTDRRVYRQGDTIILLGNTGMRLSELLGLTWRDVDFINKKLYVRQNRVIKRTYTDDGGEKKTQSVTQQGGKTKSSHREIPLNSKAIEALENLRVINGSFEYVVSTQNGNPSHPRNIDRMFRNILTACGFSNEKINGVHSLRHSFATALIRRGVDIKVVSKLLGHASISVTLDVYAHFLPEDYSAAVEQL